MTISLGKFLLFASLLSLVATARAQGAEAQTVESAYPGLASGALTYAALGELSAPVLLRSGGVEITSGTLAAEIAQAPQDMQEALRKNGLLVLEKMATRQLLLSAVRGQASSAPTGETAENEEDLLEEHFRKLAAKIDVSEQEVADFYEQNRALCGGASLEQMKGQLKAYVLGQKQQKAVSEHIRTLGQRIPITLSTAWVREQAALARDNPVDQARASGKPTVVDFGADGCVPCDMMTPVLAALREKYAGRVNVLFVHVREEPILAARYGIESIPVQVFFDAQGKEISRHTGFFPQDEVERILKGMGTQ